MKISIITPCRNSEKTIRRTIDSVLSQKLSGNELEYIIVDGKSTDSTLNIIEEYAKTFPNIKYVSEKDHSMTEALNKGMRMATGEILASINADDIYLPGTLKKVCDAFNSGTGDILLINTYLIQDGGYVKSHNTPRKFTPFICGLVECPFPECAIFFKRDSIEQLGYFNESIKYTQDLELYLRQYNKGYKFFYRNIDGSCFFVSDYNYSSTIADEMKDEVLSYFKYKWLYKNIATKPISKIIKALSGFRHYYIFKKFTYKELLSKIN